MDGDRFFYRHTSGPQIRFPFLLIHKESFAISFFCFFLNTNISRPLSGAMLEQVKLRRLSDIICENTDIATITTNVFTQVCTLYSVQCILYNLHSELKYQKKSSMCFFFQPGQVGNTKTDCSAHRKLDLDAVAKQLEAEL